MSEEIENYFCVETDTCPTTTDVTFWEFDDEIDVMNLILHYFKKYLPFVMSHKKDHKNRQIKIDPDDIGVIPEKDYGDYIVLLIPTEDSSTYEDNSFLMENTEYNFQIDIEVKSDDAKSSMINLIKLKSGVKTLLVNMDSKLGLNVTIGSFAFAGPFTMEGTKGVVRAGTYKFSVIDTKLRK